MSATYTLGGSGTHQVRLLIADTDVSGTYVFHDEELQVFLDLNSADVRLSAAQALRTLAANASKRAVWYRINGLDMDRRSVAKTLLDTAKAIEDGAISAPFEYESWVDAYVSPGDGRDLSRYSDTEDVVA
ncbi:MAG: hypothetical protein Q8S13_02225 [Dehalococcoidia bacterium]|nr:hypothetical protein [Dehalococcoidia bacterium]